MNFVPVLNKIPDNHKNKIHNQNQIQNQILVLNQLVIHLGTRTGQQVQWIHRQYLQHHFKDKVFLDSNQFKKQRIKMGAIPVCVGKTVLNAYRGVRWITGHTDEDSSWNIERPPQLQPQTRIEDTIIQDWRWLAFRCERRLVAQAKRRGPSRRIAEILGENFDIDQFACFVPRTVLEAIADGRIRYSDDFDIIIENFNAAVVFCDASGFTALTEALDKQPNGAEKLGECINNFFSPLIQIVNFWGGDIIKFSGDALTIVWPVDDDVGDTDTQMFDGRDDHFHIDQTKACRLSCQCCIDLHNNLNHFPTPVIGKFFTLHIGVGYGKVTILQVGGTLDRWEYVVAGPPMQEISIAEPLAASGETVVSPTVVSALGGAAGARLELLPDGYAKIFELLGTKISPPPPLDNIVLQDTDVELLKRFIPPAVFKRLTAGYNVFINELRRISVVFVGVHGLDVSTEQGSNAAHRLMQLTQKAAYTMEGSVNKFLVDDKGVLILIMFGLPPVYHLDDALRAVMAALRVVDGLKTLGLTAGIGVATGRVWCGTVGCDLRKEYTAMGDTVNLAARLMGKARCNEINCDLESKSLCDHVMEFRSLPPVQMKGKSSLIPIFQPTGQIQRQAVLQTTSGEQISAWSRWKYKRRLYKMFSPGYEYRHPILDYDKPPLDYPLSCGPLLPWEFIDPWMPSLMPTVDLGGVAVIVGKETEGTSELVEYAADLVKSLGRSVFLCSNMPDSTHVNIGNVPLLAWRKLCTEMIEKWRWSPSRDSKGYSKIDRDNSVYGLAKELVHPIFHWQLREMKSVLHGLILPYEVPENQMEMKTTKHSVSNVFKKAANFVAAFKKEEMMTEELIGTTLNYSDAEFDDSSLAPVISSLVTGFSMYEPITVVLHVRSGTSLFASMDSESWKVARLIGRIAMMRRRRKIELDTKDLKKWRREHSRTCQWCCGISNPYKTLNGDIYYPEWTSTCRPPPSKYYPPFIFLLVCSEMTSAIPEQQELIDWAHESNSLIQMKNLSPVETGSYLGHCLSVPRRSLPDALVEYVYRISAGIPKYISLTADQLRQGAIVIEKIGSKKYTDYSVIEEDLKQNEDKNGITFYAQGLTGKLNIRPDARSSEDDTERGSDIEFEKLHGGRSKMITVHKFKQKMQLRPVPSSIEGDKHKISRPKNQKLSVDELRVSEIIKVDADKELEIAGGLYVKKQQVHSRNDKHEVNRMRSSSEQEKKLNDDYGNTISHRHSFVTSFQQNTDDVIREGREKYEAPVRATDDKNDDTIIEPDWESRTREYRDRSHPAIRKPFIPPGPDLFTSRVGLLAHVRECKAGYETSVECQTFGNKLERLGSKENAFGPLTSIKTRPTEKLENVRVRVIKDLKTIPFVPELRAAAMSLMERLEPDEQLAAKVASVFPVAFTAFDLQAIFPRPMSSESFQHVIDNLIKKEMLENCEPPSEDQLQELDLIPLQPASEAGEKIKHGKKKVEKTEAAEEGIRETISDISSELLPEIELAANRWGFDCSGNPLYFRFISIAFQHVVADLLMSAERNFLARVSRKVICFRRIHGLSLLIKQINAKLTDSPLDVRKTDEQPNSEKTTGVKEKLTNTII